MSSVSVASPSPRASDLNAAAIRALRGGESRAAFSRRLGVTAHTVYRWELPDGAAEARRPRGEVLARLQQLAAGATSHPGPATAARARPDVAGATSPTGDPAALSAAIAAFARLMQGEWRDAEPELLRALMAGADVSEDAAALGGAGLAFAELLLRGDARAALSALGAALSAAGRERLSPGVTAMVYAVAALAHAQPDARYFDIGRVHAYQGRVDALAARGASGETRLIAGLAAGWASAISGDQALLMRAFETFDLLVAPGPPPALALLAEEALAFRTWIFGKPAEAVQQFEVAAAHAAALGASLLQARVVSSLATRHLDDLGAPERALELAQRARDLARQARAAPGLHTIYGARSAAEALFRMGRLDEASAALQELEDYWRETGLPPTGAVSLYVRVCYLRNEVDRLADLAARLRACAVPGINRLSAACALYVDAARALALGGAGPEVVATFDRAEHEASRWPFLMRETAVYRPLAFAMDPDLPGADAALRHAQRVLEGFPSPWASAHLRRAEGMIRATRGDRVEARRLLHASQATFEAAGCVTDVAMVQHALAVLAANDGEIGATLRLAEADATLRELGVNLPAWFTVAVERARTRRPGAATPARAGGAQSGDAGAGAESRAEALAVGLQRLLVPGAAPALVQRELLSVAADLFPGRVSRLEEIDSNRAAHALGGAARADDATSWVELGDGAGRRLRLGVSGALAPAEQALLSVLALAAGAALQIAALRGLSPARSDRTPDEEAADLPGFIAASPVMRRLRADLGRFAGSRATVIITGESGAGKEVVARAIHDLSPRAGRPYVAFNCAAVPRELFEGQLFGHRKGAFTGATSDQPGTIRAADGGTLFLDEIGELPLDVQPKLLRFLENGEVSTLGERRPVTVDVRIVAATHRDLEALVRQGRFREDLFFRLQVIPLRVPALRERREDVPVLARHFLRELGPKGRTPVLAPDALAALTAHPWPGNVRELRNVVERTLAYAPDATVLTAADLRL